MPGFRAREAQQAMAAEIAAALNERPTAAPGPARGTDEPPGAVPNQPPALVLEAGTGVGKTFAYLVPLLLADAKVIVSTGTKTLQDQLFERDLPAVADALGLRVQCALLKGRANYVCHHHLRRNLDAASAPVPQSSHVRVQLTRIARWVKGHPSGDRSDCALVAETDPAWAHATSTRDNCLGQDCADYAQCYVFKARRAALAAEVVVVNHHLFCADLVLREEGVSELLPSADVVVFDEAHQLADVASNFLGESVSARQLGDLAHDASAAGSASASDLGLGYWSALTDPLRGAALNLPRNCFAITGQPSGPAGEPASGRYEADTLMAHPPFSATLRAACAALEALAAALADVAARDASLSRCAERAGALLERLERWLTWRPGDDTVRWADLSATNLTMRLTPLAIGPRFAAHRQAFACRWMFVSATLALGSDFSMIQRDLGLSEPICRGWPSPYDFARQSLLYVPTEVGEPRQADYSARAVAAMRPLIEANRGRAFVLCTSLKAVAAIGASLRASLGPDLTVLVQGESSRSELLQRFRAAAAPVLVGASSFWQGIDVLGAQLSLVIIDKLPFAAPDEPVLAARLRALERGGVDPFNALQLPSAAVALKQGGGRLIRSELDRGVLMICDQRIVTRGYGRRLLRALPGFPLTRDPAQALAFIVAGQASAVPGR